MLGLRTLTWWACHPRYLNQTWEGWGPIAGGNLPAKGRSTATSALGALLSRGNHHAVSTRGSVPSQTSRCGAAVCRLPAAGCVLCAPNNLAVRCGAAGCRLPTAVYVPLTSSPQIVSSQKTPNTQTENPLPKTKQPRGEVKAFPFDTQVVVSFGNHTRPPEKNSLNSSLKDTKTTTPPFQLAPLPKGTSRLTLG